MDEISRDCFRSCKKLVSVTIPSSVEKICEYAFYGTSISALVLPTGTKELERFAFCLCRSLTRVEVSQSVETIGRFAFYGESSLSEVSCGD